jgi:hypothetical protein
MKSIDLARFNKSRESTIEAGGHSFIIRRPSVLEVHRAVSNGGSVSIDFAADQVVGWSKVNESDLINGGDPEPLAFDADVELARSRAKQAAALVKPRAAV